MRFSRELATLVIAVLVGVLVGLLSACGTDVATPVEHDDPCESSILTYENFGELFMLDWCRGCHSAAIPDGMRQGAPVAFNFEDLETIRELAPAITTQATGAMPAMPPASGPSAEERALLQEWLACGAR